MCTTNINGLALFHRLLEVMEQRAASDLHLSCHCYPTYRVGGELLADESLPEMDDERLQAITQALLSEQRQLQFAQQGSVDFSYGHQGTRFRINLYRERGGIAYAARMLDGAFHSLVSLRLPPQLERLTRQHDGLVLITGATGSGKSTTLASLIDVINTQRRCHILTIEAPIEFIHCNKLSTVHQREVGEDVPSFAQAIIDAMREDPDVILLGEMRDTETMKAALMAAETGHLVFATLHTNDAVGVIDRLVGAFPGNEQDGIRKQLSMVLRAVVTQRLIRADIGEGGARIPINEILMVNSAIASLIRNHKPEQIRSLMETSRAMGNQTLEQALAERVRERLISKELAMSYTSRTGNLQDLLRVMQNASRELLGEHQGVA